MVLSFIYITVNYTYNYSINFFLNSDFHVLHNLAVIPAKRINLFLKI